MGKVTYRQAVTDDLPQLVAIYNAVIAEGGLTADLIAYRIDQRRDWFNAHQQAPFLIHVIESEGQVLGYFYLSPWRSGRAALHHVAEVSYYLIHSARGQGLGHFMLEQAQQLALAAGLRYLLAILLDTNQGSRSLLEKGGFKLGGNPPEIADLGDKTCGQLIMYKQLKRTEP